MSRWSPSSSTDLASKATIAQLVATYQQAEATIAAAFTQIDGALGIIGAAFMSGGGKPYLRDTVRSTPMHFEDLNRVMCLLRRDVWRSIIDMSMVRKIMSPKAWEKLDRELDHDDPMPITIENVQAVLDNLRDDRDAMMQDSVASVFESLRPHRSRHKTNTELEVGPKVVLSGWVEAWTKWRSARWETNHYREQDLTALENVFRMLDGKVTAGPDGYYSDVSNGIRAAGTADRCEGETEYFTFRAWKNGNLHLGFKRLDLLAKLNAIAGGNRLRPAATD